MNQNSAIEEIANELYSLNNNIQSLMFLLADLAGKPLKSMDSEGVYRFEETTPK